MGVPRRRLGSGHVWAGAAALGLVAFGLGLGSTAAAPLVVGATGTAAVEVDIGVLDRLGPAKAAPGAGAVLIMPIPSAVVLTPLPGAVAAAQPRLDVALMPAMTPPLPRTAPAMVAVAPPPESEPEPVAEPASVVPVEPVVAAVAPEPEPQPAQPLEAASAVPVPIAEPAQPAEPLAEPEPEPEVASVEPSGPIDLTTPGPVLSASFAAGEMDLRPETERALDTLVAAMLRDENARIQLMAYAGAQGGSASAARRLSLSRALAVRGYLIENGVRSTRIDVRALGDNVEGGSAERVDVVALPR